MKSGEHAYLEQFRTMQEDHATIETAKDTPVIDLDDVDDVGPHDRLRVAAERKEAELTFLAEAVAKHDPASGAGRTSQASSFFCIFIGTLHLDSSLKPCGLCCRL